MKDKQDHYSKEIADVVMRLLDIAGHTTPRTFQTYMGVCVAHVAVSLPDDYFKEMCQVTPCTVEGCNCHVAAATFMAALKALRKSFNSGEVLI